MLYGLKCLVIDNKIEHGVVYIRDENDKVNISVWNY